MSFAAKCGVHDAARQAAQAEAVRRIAAGGLELVLQPVGQDVDLALAR